MRTASYLDARDRESREGVSAMFIFPMNALDDIDIENTIQALDFVLTKMPGQDDNPCFEYLLQTMSDERARRAGEYIERQTEIALPLFESTPAHVWALLRFAGAVVVTAAQGEPSEMAQFFCGIVLEIEDSAKKVSMATWN